VFAFVKHLPKISKPAASHEGRRMERSSVPHCRCEYSDHQARPDRAFNTSMASAQKNAAVIIAKLSSADPCASQSDGQEGCKS